MVMLTADAEEPFVSGAMARCRNLAAQGGRHCRVVGPEVQANVYGDIES
jgi:hypothetical protein